MGKKTNIFYIHTTYKQKGKQGVNQEDSRIRSKNLSSQVDFLVLSSSAVGQVKKTLSRFLHLVVSHLNHRMKRKK